MSSATDTKEKDGAGQSKDAPKSTRPSPVALEVPVSVTWAKPARPNEKRDLFTEETATVLVFRDGAVIQLAAAISIGQLLFLTHKKSKREVVCQVVQKRSFRPTSCFVELEFTEETDNFWGVTFPAKEESPAAPAMAEAVAAEEPTEDNSSGPVVAPKTEEVTQLKDEVKALRAQLQELKEKQAEEEKQAAEEKMSTEDEGALAKRLAETEAEARRAAEAEAEAKKQPATPSTESVKAPVRPQIAMKLPSLEASAAMPTASMETPKAASSASTARGNARDDDESIEDLLPKPALDFSKAKVVDPNDPFNIYRPARKPIGNREKMTAGGLAALLAVAIGVAWYMNRLPFLHRAPKATVAAKSAPAVTAPDPVSAVSMPAVSTAAPASPPVAANVPVEAPSAAPANTTVAPETPSKPAASIAETVVPAVAPAVKKPAASQAKSSSEGRYAPARVSSNRGKAVTSAESKPQPAPEVVASNEPVIPAQLLHSVSPVYPPDAMRHYITGDVRLEADVDAKGRVGAMRVILGPAAFREAAMDALRQYEYAPATQGGKPVASKVVVTVKFWFDP